MDLTARVQLFPLIRRQEGEEYVVGRTETNSFIYLPAAGVTLIDLLDQGLSLQQVQEEFARRHGETPDIADFVQSLAELGFVRSTSNAELAEVVAATSAAAATQGHFATIPQPVAARFFTRPLLWFYGLYVAGAVALIISTAGYLPRSLDQLWHPWVMLSVLGMLAFNIVQTFCHEFAHLLAARAQGVAARMGLSRRLLELVAVTDISGLYAVPIANRYLPYVAGMIWDALVGASFVYLLKLSDSGLLPLPQLGYAAAKAGVFICTTRLLWQLKVHLKTDLYYILANRLQARNLQADSVGYLRNLWSRLRGRPAPHDLSALPRRELTVVRRYSLLLVGLLSVYWVSFIFLQIPFYVATVPRAVRQLAAGWSADPAGFGDSLAFLILLALNYGLVVYLLVRDRLAARRQPAAPAGGQR